MNKLENFFENSFKNRYNDLNKFLYLGRFLNGTIEYAINSDNNIIEEGFFVIDNFIFFIDI